MIKDYGECEFFSSALGPGRYCIVGMSWVNYIQGYVAFWLHDDPSVQWRFNLHSN